MRTPNSSAGKVQIASCYCYLEVQIYSIDIVLIWFSAISFILFGSGCFFSDLFRREYDRYGLPQFRGLMGCLQIIGAIGLWAGIHTPWVGQLAASGLALLMLCGVGLRIKIKDSALQTLPALAYMSLNAYLALASY